MFKRFIVLLLLVLICPLALAEGHFYVGLNGAFSVLGLKKVHKFTLGTQSATDKDTSYGDGAQENVLAGYGYRFKNNLYLGAQAFAGISQLKEDSSNDYHSASFVDNSKTFTRTEHQYGFSLKPGYWIFPHTLLFATIGAVRANFYNKHTYSRTGLPSLTTKKDANVWGMKFSLGTELLLSKHWAATLAIAYQGYQSYKLVSGPQSRINQTTVTPHIYSGEVGIEYLI